MAKTRTTISIPESLFERVDALASRSQVPRSRLFVLAVEEYLQKIENQDLFQAINAACDDSPTPEEEARRKGLRRKHRQQVQGQ